MASDQEDAERILEELAAAVRQRRRRPMRPAVPSTGVISAAVAVVILGTVASAYYLLIQDRWNAGDRGAAPATAAENARSPVTAAAPATAAEYERSPVTAASPSRPVNQPVASNAPDSLSLRLISARVDHVDLHRLDPIRPAHIFDFGQGEERSRDLLLQLVVQIRNETDREMFYQPPDRLALVDEHGQEYRQGFFIDATPVGAQLEPVRLKPGEVTTDVFVFEPPATAARLLTLRMPADERPIELVIRAQLIQPLR